MAKSLLIVESPAKVKTIKKFLGPDFDVRASVGHVVDLPPSRLGVSLDEDFTPEYQVIKGKEKVVNDLKKLAKKAEVIYLAQDPDREGEAIAWHLADQLGGDEARYHRVLFHELTKAAVLRAVDDPQPLDSDRFDSQQARRVLDRLVGYQISPLLWDKVKRGLSAGRVQSVALRLVVERERAIQAFEAQEYWTLTAKLAADQPPLFLGRLAKLNNKKFSPTTEAETMAALEAIKSADFVVDTVKTSERQKKAPPPFITSTLQQEAFRKLGYAPKRTMSLAQRLYEGLQTDEGQVGLITYMRTDSHRLAKEAVAELRGLIAERFGPDYVPARPPVYKARKSAQEAHEAIRPTSSLRTPEALAKYLKKDELALYRLIWQRTVACQMAPAVYDRTLAEISAGPGMLRSSGQILRFKGFTALYTEGQDEGSVGDKNEEDADGLLPPLEPGQKLTLKELDPKQHFTQPPPRFTEASLVRELEEKGIGRPSTYAAILSTVQSKDYVVRQKKHLMPTPLGMVVSDLLVENFPQVMDVGFTAGLEESLDKVEEGGQDWRRLLSDFYGPFSQALDKAKTDMKQIKGQGLPTDIDCPQCGKKMSIRLGKHGEFLACSGYPDCKSTADFTRDDKGNVVIQEPAPDPGIDCEKCGSPMVVKKGRYGPFLACSAYPKCRSIVALDEDGKPAEAPEPELIGEKCPKCGGELVIKPTRNGGRFISCSNYPDCRYSRGVPVGVACPQCGAELVEKRSRRGKVFFGCDAYPKCDYATWDRPVAEPCPECGGKFLLHKKSKKGEFYRCPNKDCGYQREVDD